MFPSLVSCQVLCVSIRSCVIFSFSPLFDVKTHVAYLVYDGYVLSTLTMIISFRLQQACLIKCACKHAFVVLFCFVFFCLRVEILQPGSWDARSFSVSPVLCPASTPSKTLLNSALRRSRQSNPTARQHRKTTTWRSIRRRYLVRLFAKVELAHPKALPAAT